jgi:hypothetical protein
MNWLIYLSGASVLGACLVMFCAGFMKGCR